MPAGTHLVRRGYESLNVIGRSENGAAGGKRPDSRAGGGRCGSSCWSLPHRYVLAVTGLVGLLLTVGTRAFFALVLTHVTNKNVTDPSNDLIFSNCTALNSSLEAVVDIGGDTLFLIHTAYFIGYFAMTLPSSVLCTWLSPVTLTGSMMLLHSLVTFLLPSVLLFSTPLLFVLRVVQGLSEGGQQPIIIGLISAWSIQHDKTLLTSIFITGIYVAPVIAFVMTSTCLCYVSWSSIFYIYGAAGVIWSAVWLSQFYDTPQQHPSLSAADQLQHNRHGTSVKDCSVTVLRNIPWRKLLRSPAVWAVCLASLGRNLIFSAMVVEQPQYFLDSFKMNVADIGVLGTVPHLAMGVSCVVGGVISDRLIRCGLSRTLTRKLAFTAGTLVEGLCLVGLYFTEDWSTAFLILSFGIALGGMASAGYIPLAADMAPQYAGVISGLSQLGSCGAVISTALASTITGTAQTIESWQSLFLLVGCILLGIMLLFDVFADARQLSWASESNSLSPLPESRGNPRGKHVQPRGSSPVDGLTQIPQDSEETALLTESLGGGDDDGLGVGTTRYGAVTMQSSPGIRATPPPAFQDSVLSLLS